jgi:raffinose/stachyose/melibiose transport system substrate-binding protein
MKNRFIIAALMILVATSFAMAGGGGDRGGRTTVRFFHRWPNEPRNSYFHNLVRQFERQNPDIRVEMDYVINDVYKEKIRVLVSSNDIPDVFCSWSDSFAENLVGSGRILALNDMLARDRAFANRFMASQIEPFTFNGNVYGLPLTIDGKVLVYNRDIFDRAGITRLPTTYSELISTLEALRRAGWEAPIMGGFADTWAISHYQGTIFQRLLPPAVLARDTNPMTGEFTHPGYRRGLEILQQLVTFMGPNAVALGHIAVYNHFVAGNLPMMYMQLMEFGFVNTDAPNLNYGFFNFPAIEGGAGNPSYLTGAPEGFMMSNTTRVPEQAERLFKFIFDVNNMQEFVRVTGAPVGVIGAVTPQNSFPKMLEAINMIDTHRSFPWFDNAVDIRIADAFMRGSQAIAAGHMTIDRVLADAQAAAMLVRNEAR